MDERSRWVWIGWIVAFFLLVVLVAPKNMEHFEGDSVRICDCLGISRSSICFGVPSSCTSIRLKSTGSSEPDEYSGTQITLIIDKSLSMKGEKLASAIKAASSLISAIQPNDAVAIVAFSNESVLIQDFTDNKPYLLERLAGIRADGGTRYLPALNTALFKTSQIEDKPSKVVFLTDGEPEDISLRDVMFSKVQELAERGSCLYTIGYGNLSEKAVDILQGMALTSKKVLGCGRYFNSSEDALQEVLKRIMNDVSNKELRITIESPKPEAYQTDAVQVRISTNVDAFCSYSLNSRSKQDMVSFNISIIPDQGRNELEITCQSYLGRQDRKTASVTFYADKPLTAKGKKISVKDRDVKSILSDIAVSEGFAVHSRVIAREGETYLAFLVENAKPFRLDQVVIRQFIPEDVSNGRLLTENSYTLVQEMPIVVDFPFDSLLPGEKASFSYTLPGYVSAEDAKRIKTQITHAPITEDAINYVVSADELTRSSIDIEMRKRKADGKSQIHLSIAPQAPIEKLKVYMNIPKCMADRLNKLYFRNSNYIVLSDDPMVLWNFVDISERQELSAEVDADIYDDCLDEVGIITVAEGEKSIARKRQHSSLLPIAMLFLVIVLYLIDKTYLENNFRKTSATSKVAMTCIMIVLLITLAYPRAREKEGLSCSCFGVSYGDLCYGLVHDCSSKRSYKEHTESYCKIQSCEELLDMKASSGKPSDLTLIMDRSYSMKGTKITEAKNAAFAFLWMLSAEDRLALIQFDNQSELVQPFTNDLSVLADKISQIEPRWSTSYIPPLKEAYYNYLFNSRNSSRRQIIFVSDGAPSESHDEIFSEVRMLAQQVICLITIGFGEEIYPGSDAETVLKGMAAISEEATSCGRYYYSPTKMDSLKENIQEAYKESHQEKSPVKIMAEVGSFDINTAEPLFLDATAEIASFGKLPCRIPFRMSLVSDRGIKNELLYDEDSGRYYLGDMKFPEGVHHLTLHAEPFSGQKDCGFDYSQEIGSIVVKPFSGFSECSTASCHDVADYLSAESNETAVVYVTDSGFNPQNITIRKGTKVTWINRGKEPHQVISGEVEPDGLFSHLLLPNESFSYTYPEGGPFFYFDNYTGLGGMGLDLRFKRLLQSTAEDGIDLAIVIDQSGSMSGEMMAQVKNATKKLVSELSPKDRIAVIRFSDDAFLVSGFTDDRDLVQSKIESIYATGGTLYLPALEKVEKVFDQHSRSASKIVIFFSDGEPWDKGGKEAIMAKVRGLVEKKICIYAVGYGEEISPQSRGEMILREIVDISRNDTHCGRYLYSRLEEDRLSRIFGTIYYETKSLAESLDVLPRISRKVIYENETLAVSAKVLSSFNRQYLPGFKEGSCGPPADVRVAFIDEKNRTVLEKELSYSGSSSGYTGYIKGLKPGIYTAKFRAKARTSTGSLCGFEGSAEKSIIVLSGNETKVDFRFIAFIVALIVVYFALVINSSALKHIDAPAKEENEYKQD